MSAQLQTILNGESAAPPEIVNFLDHRLVVTSGVWATATNNLQVNQETSPAMSVKVHQGYASILNSTGSTHYPVALTVADASVAITSNSSGFSRIDSIVLYINTGGSPNADATNIATLVAVAGTPSGSPSAPSAGTIQAAVGASNPYIVLGNVTVASGASSIVDANISDQRALVKLNTTFIPSSLNFATSDPQASFSSASTSFVDVTGATVTINPTASAKVSVTISGRLSNNNGSAADTFVQLVIDGVVIHTFSVRPNTGSLEASFCVSGQATVAAGARVIKLQAKVTTGTGTWDQANVNVIWG